MIIACRILGSTFYRRPRKMPEAIASPVTALMRPRSIAVIGASTQPHKAGGMPVRLLLEHGYTGLVVPVHPSASEIQGLPAIASLREASQAIDMAIVCVPQAAVRQAIADCVACGVKAAVLFTGGFAEAGDQGLAEQDEIVQLAAHGGMALLGPNCLGAINLRERMFATFSPATLRGMPPLGGIGLVSQSGAFGAYAYVLARRHQLGLSHWVTTGNEAGIQVADVIEWLAEDPDTRVILAYLEGCKDGPRLVRALRAALAAGKPVVITKVGRTSAGARAAMSHTAAIAGEDAVFDAVFDECGAIRANTIEDFFRYGQLFATAPVPHNDAVAIITGSGGVGTLMADRADDLGLQLPPFTQGESLQVTEQASLATTGNPIDVTGQVVGNPRVLEVACEIAADSGRYGSIALFTAAGALSPAFWPTLEKCARSIASRPGITATVAGIMDDSQRQTLTDFGCLVYEEPTHAIEAIAQLRRYARVRQDIQHLADPPPLADLRLPVGTLDEADALRVIAEHGIGVVPHGVAGTADEAVALAQRLGGDLAIKVVSPDIVHKSDVGGVRLNVSGDEAVRQAFNAILAEVSAKAPTARIRGVVVARMVRPVLECVVASRHDPIFGPVLTFGLGGTEVEWLRRVAIATAPVSPQRVLQLLERLDLLCRLNGWRGGPVVPPDALVNAICAVGRMASTIPALVHLEINPLLVNADGVFAADALMQIQ